MDEKQDLYPGFKAKYALYIIFGVLVFIGLFVLMDKLSTPTTFTVYNPITMTQYIENPDELKDEYNSKSDSMPFILKWAFGNDRINLTFVRINNEKAVLAVYTKRGKIQNITKGEMIDPTIQMMIEEDALNRISRSKKPLGVLEQALDDKEVTYKGEKLTSSVKSAIVLAVINVLALFG